jgi:hypothetical protein
MTSKADIIVGCAIFTCTIIALTVLFSLGVR